MEMTGLISLMALFTQCLPHFPSLLPLSLFIYSSLPVLAIPCLLPDDTGVDICTELHSFHYSWRNGTNETKIWHDLDLRPNIIIIITCISQQPCLKRWRVEKKRLSNLWCHRNAFWGCESASGGGCGDWLSFASSFPPVAARGIATENSPATQKTTSRRYKRDTCKTS